MNNSNKQTAYEYFRNRTNLKNFVLHHIDVNMKKKNPKRYAEWRITDLVPMTVKDHMSLHMALRHQKKQMKRTAEWNKNVSKAMLEHNYFVRAGYVFKLINSNGHELKRVFRKPAQIAKYLGCTKQTVYRILNKKYPNETVYGYSIKMIKGKEVAA